jgi:biopolymer transport protein ExbD
MPLIEQPEEPQSMSAMTDVVFLLLIFFIVTMSSFVEMTLLETNLPTASNASSGKVDLQRSVRIDVTSEGNYLINGTQQSQAAINILLRRYARLMPEAEFLIQCAPDSKHHLLVTLLANCSKYHLKNLKLLR